MDAGLAGVLGATVGAVGTGGAAVVAALLARSQARFQLTAEHRKSLREPRRAAYVAYASALRETYELFVKAKYLAEDAHASTDRREELRAEALREYQEATQRQAAMEHDAAVIHVEGPREVTRASVGASSKLQKFRSAVLDYMSAATELDADHRFALLEEKEAEAHTGYLEFLYAASDALDADLLALGE